MNIMAVQMQGKKQYDIIPNEDNLSPAPRNITSHSTIFLNWYESINRNDCTARTDCGDRNGLTASIDRIDRTGCNDKYYYYYYYCYY